MTVPRWFGAGASPAGELVLDRTSVRSVDRAAIEEYGIPGLLLMENAARGLAAAAMEMLADAGDRPTVLLVCGSGNNGGDGYALARHLHNAGCRATCAGLGEPREGSDARLNHDVCRRMGIDRIPWPEEPDEHGEAHLIVDAIFGTGLDRPVEGAAAEAIDWINGAGRPVLAVDVPSGLDCDRGRPLGVAVRASRTVTFVARKPGLLAPAAAGYVGQVTVADIGAPVELIRRFGRPVAAAAGSS